MKLKNLLLLGGLLTAMSASAELSITQRTAPTVTTTTPVIDGETVQYLYNVGAKSFFLGANEWNTRASVSTDKGYKVKLTDTSAGTGVSGTLSITDSVETQKAWKKTFAESQTGIWVDNNTGANCDTWVFTTTTGDNFTITNNGIADSYLGVVAGGGDTRLYLYTAETEDFVYEWAAVSVEAYEAYIPSIKVFNAAGVLLEKLQKADEEGVTTLDEYIAVYNNPEATLEDLTAATDAVNELITIALANKATADNPADLTNKIVNASFDTDVKGWSGTALAFGNAAAEHYNKNYDTYQTISGLQPGVYALSVQGFYRSGSTAASYTNFLLNEKNYAMLYAINFDDVENDTVVTPIANPFEGILPNNKFGDNTMSATDEDGNVYYIPNNMATSAQYFNADYYNDNVVFFEVSKGEVKLGIKKESLVDTDWTMINGFTLKYFGHGVDAYQMWYFDLLSTFPIYEESDMITLSALEEYNQALKAAKAAEVSDKNSVFAAYAVIEAAYDKVAANVSAWKVLMEQLDASYVVVTNPEMMGEDMDILADYIMELEDIIYEKQISTEEVLAAAAELKLKTSNAIQNAIKPGTAYDQLKNVDFANGFQNWTVEKVNGGDQNVAANSSAKCAEAWNSPGFDIYQQIENAPVGCYEISLQGFYRRGRGDAAWLYYYSPEGEKRLDVPEVPVYVYMNSNKTPISYVYDYQVSYSEDGDGNETHLYAGTDYYKDPNGEFVYPNNMASAGRAFDQGAYEMSAFGLVAKKGDALRVGVKGNARQDNDSWPIFTRFKLIYQGFEASIVGPKLREAIDAVDLSKAMGVDIKETATALKAAGETAYATNDGRTMFDALAAIYDYNDTIETSVNLFAQLASDIVAIMDYAPEASNVTIKEEVIAYAEGIKQSIAEGNMTDEQAQAAIDKLAEYTTKLGYPAAYEQATDAAPADFTAVIKSPGFEKGGVNSVEGWTASGYNFGNDDTQKSALALEYYHKKFDMYQTVDVPNGTYQVSAKAFSRNDGDGSISGADSDYNQWAAGIPTNARLYAISANDTVTVNIEHQASTPNASLEAIGGGQFVAADENTYYVPNSMVEFRTFVDDNAERYLNAVVIKVTDGKLKIGFKCDVTNEWVIMDDVTLTYFGTSSTKEQTGWTTNIDTRSAAPAQVEFFQLTGAKANAMKKGFNIVRTIDANGNVKVQKVIVR